MSTLQEVLHDEYGLSLDLAQRLVVEFAEGIDDPELAEQYPLVTADFSHIIEENPQLAQAFMDSVVANGFMVVAAGDAERLNAASRNAFSGDSSSITDMRSFKLNPSWSSFLELFGDKMTTQPEAVEVFSRRNDLDPLMWKLSIFISVKSYIHAVNNAPVE